MRRFWVGVATVWLALLPLSAFADDLPAAARRLLDQSDKEIGKIEARMEEATQHAQAAVEAGNKAIEARRKKLLDDLEKLEASLRKEGKIPQADAVQDEILLVKNGPPPEAPSTLSGVAGGPGQVLYYQVVGAVEGTVWGTGTYTDDSSIASAAVHAGVVPLGKKMLVKITILAGENAYQGTTQNGVTTNDWPAWNRSFKIEVAKKRTREAPEKQGISADPGTLTALRGQVGKSFLFEVVGSNTGNVWGTDTYTDDSSLATAAVHAGLLKVGQKGIIKVTIAAGQASYDGSTRHGVTTSPYAEYFGSYTLSRGKK